MASPFIAGSVNASEYGKVNVIGHISSEHTHISLSQPSFRPLNPKGFVSNVPQQTIAYFIERVVLSNELAAQLHDRIDTQVSGNAVSILYGLGGAGKTQLVLDYIQKYQKDYQGVFWIDLRTRQSLEASLREIYQRLYETSSVKFDESAQKSDEILARIKTWFSGRPDKWLLILDNADNVENEDDPEYIDVISLIPPHPSVHVIITTRNSKLVRITKNRGIELGPLTTDEALSLVWCSAQLDDEEQLTLEEKDTAKKLVEELGFLALAVDLAGSVISEVDELDLVRYLAEYQSNRAELLNQKPEVATQYSSSIIIAWETTYIHLRHRSALAASLLGFLSLLDSRTISLEYFRDALSATQATDSSENTSMGIKWEDLCNSAIPLNAQKIEKAFAALKVFGLVKFHKEDKVYSMHKLVHEWGFERLQSNRERQKICKTAGDFVSVLCKTYKNPRGYQFALSKHISRLFDVGAEILLGDSEQRHEPVVGQMIGYALFADRTAQWEESERLWKALKSLCEKFYEEDHEVRMTVMSNFMNIVSIQQKFEEAESIGNRILEHRQRAFGDNNFFTIGAMNNLAIVYKKMGKLEDALDLQSRAARASEQTLGPDHHCTLSCQNNLVVILKSVGNLEKALPLLEIVVTARKKTYGNDNVDTLTALNNLADIYGELGKLEQAVSIQRNVVRTLSRTRGEDDSYTIFAENKLAEMLAKQEKFDEAVLIHDRIVKNRKTLLGDQHPETLQLLNNQAITFSKQGRLDDAARLQRWLLQRLKSLLGPDHIEIRTVTHNLADTLACQGNTDEAEPLQRELYEKGRQLFGEEHSYTIAMKNTLAHILRKQNRISEAIALYEQVLESRQLALTKDHPETIDAVNQLALALQAQGQFERAMSLQELAYAERNKVYGEDAMPTMLALYGLARLRLQQGLIQDDKLLEAEVTLSHLLSKARTNLGRNHHITVDVMAGLANARSKLKKFEEVYSLRKEVLEIRERTHGAEAVRTVSAMYNLALSLRDLGRMEEAIPIQLEVIKKKQKFYGEDHLYATYAIGELANTYQAQRKFEDAILLRQEMLDRRIRNLGERHPETIRARDRLLDLCQERDRSSDLAHNQ